ASACGHSGRGVDPGLRRLSRRLGRDSHPAGPRADCDRPALRARRRRYPQSRLEPHAHSCQPNALPGCPLIAVGVNLPSQPSTRYDSHRVIALQLDGKVAVVTGGGRGLGAAAAWALAEAGADIALLARSEEQVVGTAREIEDATGRKVLACQCDVTDEASVDGTASLVIATFRRGDVFG